LSFSRSHYLYVLCIAAAVVEPKAPLSTGTGKGVEVDLDLISVLRKVLAWMKENNISLEDIFSSDFFNSDFFNSDFFNSDYFNSDFFNSELFNSEIFNRDNFLKVTTALFGLDGLSNDGEWQPDVAAQIMSFFEHKDWQGLKNYLNGLPAPAESIARNAH